MLDYFQAVTSLLSVPPWTGRPCFGDILKKNGTTFGTVGEGEYLEQILEEAAKPIKYRQSYSNRYVHTLSYEKRGLVYCFQVSLLMEVASPGLQLVMCSAGHVGW